jgi:hypothetical protein
MTEKPTPPLSYDRPPQQGIPRWQFRLLLLLVLLNLAITIQSVYAPGVASSLKTRWSAYQSAKHARAIQHQAMTWSEPPGKVVWDEDPQTAAALLARPDYAAIAITNGYTNSLPAPLPPGARARLPAVAGPLFNNLLPDVRHPFQSNEMALVMLHGRKSSAGGEALVCVGAKGNFSLGFDAGELSPTQPDTKPLGRRLSIVAAACDFPNSSVSARAEARQDRIAVLVIERGKSFNPVRHELSNPTYSPSRIHWTPPQANQPGKLTIDPAGAFRLYAGQPDPKDASHFTIDYDFDGRRGTIHGYLKPNGGIELKPDTGQVSGRSWNPNSTPQSAPSER